MAMENKVLSFFPDVVAIENMDFLLATVSLLEGFSVLFVTKTAVPLFFVQKQPPACSAKKRSFGFAAWRNGNRTGVPKPPGVAERIKTRKCTSKAENASVSSLARIQVGFQFEDMMCV